MNNEFSDALGEDNEKQFHKLLQKTRRKTILRNIIISVLCTFVILIGLMIVNRLLLSRSFDEAHSDISYYKQISDPNVSLGEFQSLDGFGSGTAEYKTYKVIEGIPLPWAEMKIHYNVLSQFSQFDGGYSPISIVDPDMVKQGMNFTRSYNVLNGQRELLFYHPEVKYTKMMNELSELSKMNAEKRVEMAISFDKGYTLEEIRNMLPSGIHARWYWVDTYTPQYITFLGETMLPISNNNVFGYAAYIDNEEYFENNEEKFITYVKDGLALKGNYHWQYQQIFDKLRGNKTEPTKDQVHNIGVVVTGSAKTLNALQNKSYVRGAVLGAIVDKY
ncbi:anti sigma factor C-terminal domain-containing protein [Paenibacillus pini]|uniref:Sigma factor regulator C-terminal domain-containing protein n=2 Tax=Paenibacillus TaxID=44249 RepID=W7Z3A1_9BACL|nr:hypothetical protein JCM16418_3065 [Paenibacillus pini JCM 16418]